MRVKILIFSFLLAFLFIWDRLNAQIKIEIADSNSLARYGPFPFHHSVSEKKIALDFYKALSTKNLDGIKRVESFYYEHFKNEDFIDIKYYGPLYWISKCITADRDVLAKELEDPISKDVYDFFTQNNYEKLKDFLALMYELNNYEKLPFADLGFCYDLLTLNAPTRENWEKISEFISYLPLKKGEKIIDLGCGFGYTSFQLSKVVGETGKVFATDINKQIINHLTKTVEKSGVKNIFPLLTDPDSIGVHDSVDAVLMCELYHDLYGGMPDFEMNELFNSMKHVLKINGYLIIVENLDLPDKYFVNPYIDKRLIIAQLAYSGFKYVDFKEFPPCRYMLIFKHTNEKVDEQTLYTDKKPHDKSFFINVSSRKSLFKFSMPTIDKNSFNEKRAARLAYNFFETADSALAMNAIELYDSLILNESFGGEYSAIQWLCKIKSNPDEKRNLLLGKNLLSLSFYNTMSKNNDSIIKYYLKFKYRLFDKEAIGLPDSLFDKKNKSNKKQTMHLLEDYILSFNPSLKKSNTIVENLKIQKSQVIVDLGSGQGYYSYLFSQLVGEEGRVYAIETSSGHSMALENFIKENNIKNIEIIKNSPDVFLLKEKADKIFMCSMYPRLYSISEADRQKFISSIKENLSTDGHLIIVDDGPKDDEKTSYQGSFINKELIVYQLAFYGFELINDLSLASHSYMLTFRLKNK